MKKGNSSDIERANQHKRLFEQMLAKSSKKDGKDRNKEAQDMMDHKLGPKWREESEAGGVMHVHIDGPSIPETQDEMDGYYDKVRKVSDEEGLPSPVDAPTAGKEDQVNSMMARLKQILMKVL